MAGCSPYPFGAPVVVCHNNHQLYDRKKMIIQEGLKRMSDIVPALLLTSAIVAGTVGYFANAAIIDHDKQDKAHPQLESRIVEQSSRLDLLSQEFRITQKQNVDTHQNTQKKLDRIITVLDLLAVKQGIVIP
jgi:hypothetical protein